MPRSGHGCNLLLPDASEASVNLSFLFMGYVEMSVANPRFRLCLFLFVLMALVTACSSSSYDEYQFNRFMLGPSYAKMPCTLLTHNSPECFEHVRTCVKRFCDRPASFKGCSFHNCAYTCSILNSPRSTWNRKVKLLDRNRACFPDRPTPEDAWYLGNSPSFIQYFSPKNRKPKPPPPVVRY